MDEPRNCYTKRKKLLTKGHILYDFVCPEKANLQRQKVETGQQLPRVWENGRISG